MSRFIYIFVKVNDFNRYSILLYFFTIKKHISFVLKKKRVYLCKDK
jgi:hypothetical protein